MKTQRLRAVWFGKIAVLAALAAWLPAQSPATEPEPTATSPAPAIAGAPPAVLPLPANVAAAIATFQQEKGIPGMSVAIATPRSVRAQGFGLADLENDVPATAATVYRLGSISKPVTAVAVLQLAAQQKLALDGDVRTWVPEFPEKAWPVTLRQLLGHLGGVRHYMRGETESTVHYESQREGLGRFAGDALLHEPGTKYLYSTYGYNLLAAAVEAASGQNFGAYVRTHIAGPAGATTLQDDDVLRLIKHRAQGYVRQGEKLQNSDLMDGSYKLGGGGLCSSAPDLARFGLALLDGRLLSPRNR
jgi:CubicO group peptidase (beta-lactamase class C family)